MGRQQKPQKLFWHVILRVLPLAVLALVAVGYYASVSIERTEQAEVQDILRRESNHALDLIVHPINTLVAETEALAANDLMVNGLIDTENRGTYLPTFFQSLRVPGPKGAQISLLDYRGRIIATNMPPSTWTPADWTSRIRAGNTTAELTSSGFAVFAPVRYQDLPEGAIVLRYAADELAELFDIGNFPVAATLVGADGQVIYSSDPDFAVAGEFLPEKRMADWITMVRPIPGFPGLHLIAAEPTEEALATVREVRRILLITLLGSIIALIGAAAVAAYLATREVGRLSNLIGRIGSADDMGRRVDMLGPAELRALGNSFNEMLERLQRETTSRAYFDRILNSLSEILLVTALDGRIQTANPAARLFLAQAATPDDPFGGIVAGAEDFGPGTDPEHFLNWNDEAHALQARYEKPDGKTLTILWLKSVLRDASGLPNGLIFVGQDVSDWARMEELKNEFISTVNHELRTPLTSIAGTLGLLKGGIAGDLPKETNNLIEIGHSNCQRLINLINDILDIQKMESGGMEFRKEPVDLVRIAEMSVKLNDSFAAKYGVRFAFENCVGTAPIVGDTDRLGQVMTNLLSNAAKYSPRGGVVRVVVAAGDDGPIVAVTDRGPGIPMEFRDRIFQRFAQADSSDTRKKDGTGLGLSIAKAIVDHHDGRIWYDSGEGRGTTFRFSIPARAAAGRSGQINLDGDTPTTASHGSRSSVELS